MTQRSAPSVAKQLLARLPISESAKPIVANTGWMMAYSALRMVLGILVGAWVARYLGPSRFGELAYAVAFVAFFQGVGKLGLDSITIRDMSRDAAAASTILGTTLWLRLLTGLIGWMIAIAGMALLRPGDTTALILVAIVAGTVLFQATDTVDLWFQSRSQSKRSVIAKTLALLIASAVRIAMILLQAPLAAFAVALLIEAALAALALAWSYRRYPTVNIWQWDSAKARGMLREAWPFLLSGLAILVYMRIDQLMLREMIGEHELGIYSAALPLSTAWYFIPTAICASVAPVLARKKARSEAEYMHALSRLFSLMWWYSLPLCLGVALLSGPLVNILYGSAFAASAAVLAIHVFANTPVALGVAQSQWIVNERRGRFALYRTVAGAASNVVLNLYFIPMYGAVGAAIATIISQTIAAIAFNLFMAPNILILQMLSLICKNPVSINGHE